MIVKVSEMLERGDLNWSSKEMEERETRESDTKDREME